MFFYDPCLNIEGIKITLYIYIYMSPQYRQVCMMATFLRQPQVAQQFAMKIAIEFYDKSLFGVMMFHDFPMKSHPT